MLSDLGVGGLKRVRKGKGKGQTVGEWMKGGSGSGSERRKCGEIR